jgi:hypothetical protein
MVQGMLEDESAQKMPKKKCESEENAVQNYP